MKIKVAPSILSADFSRLYDEIKRAEASGADMLHIDVMDGHFVPNITIGPAVVASIRRVTKLPLDTHLMIEAPEKLIPAFVKAGSDMITVHIETIAESGIKALGPKLNAQKVKLGISLNPETPQDKIETLLKYADFLLVMSVHPGFSGQAFIPEAVERVKKMRALYSKDISVDGGMNQETAGLVIRAGANIIAAGSYIFGSEDIKSAIERIRNAGNS